MLLLADDLFLKQLGLDGNLPQFEVVIVVAESFLHRDPRILQASEFKLRVQDRHAGKRA